MYVHIQYIKVSIKPRGILSLFVTALVMFWGGQLTAMSLGKRPQLIRVPELKRPVGL